MDVEIVQEEDTSRSHTWKNYKFSDFSDWVNVFRKYSESEVVRKGLSEVYLKVYLRSSITTVGTSAA